MNISEAIDYINAHTWSQWKLGLSRTRELLARLGDPQKKLRFVHVAGSNGKGSTCAMLERILREAGYRTGLYPSPYIEDFRERIQVCGAYISEEALCRITEQVRDIADAMEDHPTQFELITAIGMLYFLEKKCDIVLLEVGLGGLYDSTNIIDAPEAAVITNIGLEHTEYLGNTLAEIAGSKCGIIKSGADVVCYENVQEVMDVVLDTCREKGCPLQIACFDRLVPMEKSLEGQTFLWKGEPDEIYTLALLGEYQLRNAAVALTVVEVLRGRGFSIPAKAVRAGLTQVQWPARFEVLSKSPVFILDGGHNPQCAEALAQSLQAYFPGRKMLFLMGMLADKDYRAVIGAIAPFAAGFVCLTPDSPRALSAQALSDELREMGFQAKPCAAPGEGILEALRAAGGNVPASRRDGAGDALPVIAFGSLYMAGDVRRAFPEALAAFQKECGGNRAGEKTGEQAGEDTVERIGNQTDGKAGEETGEQSDEDTEERTGNRTGGKNGEKADAIRIRKKRQREEALRRRRMLSEKERTEKSAAICRALKSLPALQRAHTVFTYAAAQEEADPDAVNRWLEAGGKKVCYPRIRNQKEMDAVVPDSADPQAWRTGSFGIREPLAERSVPVPAGEIDAVLVPCVAFDRRGGRCGHGAGYYDRWLADLPAGVPRILIAFDAQEVSEIAQEETDIRMDLVVTESGVRQPV